MTAAGAPRTFPIVYTTCLFCHAGLGRNEVLEALPVGRRLAYDQDKGRLWVVCRRCERWNLTPQEERWEAMEQAERLYRGTRLRASTDNVGLARLRDGTELVRIGRPLRPEFAAWRYGDQFGRRRVRQGLLAVGGVAAVGVVFAGGAWAGAGMGGFAWLFGQAADRAIHGSPDKVVTRIPTSREVLYVKRKHLGRTALVPSTAGPFGLHFHRPRGDVLLEGEEALRAAELLFPAANRFGGSKADVADAVARIVAAGGPEGLVASAGQGLYAVTSRVGPKKSKWASNGNEWRKSGLMAVGKVSRLALEMALHEERERQAIAGELAPLEEAWRRAEEIAAIADDLLLPEGVGAKLGQLKARNSARTGAPSSPTTDSGAASNS